MSAETQIRALAAQGMAAEDISREVGVELTSVKLLLDESEETFSKDEKIAARRVITSIAQGGATVMGDPIPAAVQLKAAMYVHSGGNVVGNSGGLNIHMLQQMILASRQSAVEKMTRVLGVEEKPSPFLASETSPAQPSQLSPGPVIDIQAPAPVTA